MITRLWNKLSGYILTCGAFLAGLLLVERYYRAQGRREAETEQKEKDLQDVTKARRADAAIRALPDDAVNRMLRENGDFRRKL